MATRTYAANTPDADALTSINLRSDDYNGLDPEQIVGWIVRITEGDTPSEYDYEAVPVYPATSYPAGYLEAGCVGGTVELDEEDYDDEEIISEVADALWMDEEIELDESVLLVERA